MNLDFYINLSLYLFAEVIIFLSIIVIIASYFNKIYLFQKLKFSERSSALWDIKNKAIDKCSHFERLLVGIGSFEVGIMGYVASVVFFKDTKIENANTFYILIILLLYVTTVAYLHTWKIYIAYSSYCVRLEILSEKHELRLISEVFYSAQNPPVSKWIKPVVSCANSIQLIVFFPVLVLIAAVVGFGLKFGLPGKIILAIVIIIIGFSVIYTAPSIIEFFKLVKFACNPPKSHK
ncbi:MAG: hypothetical protein GF353_10640 [Candidatus Lokiarchaeota archaeon]|nr:hypothetical protein [Candidatus Lokiarchaeota archaeon]